MDFHAKAVESTKKMFLNSVEHVKMDAEENVVSKIFADYAKEIWEAIGDDGILTSVEYNPVDSMGGSLSFRLSTMAPDYFIRLWYDGKNQTFLFSFCKQLSGNLVHQIPDTFNESGIAKVSNIDKFNDYFLMFLAKEKYNAENKIVYAPKQQKNILG